MVSGLVTSPCDQLRIFSGEASEIRMESKSAIKFALSYGEERYMISPIKSLDPGAGSQESKGRRAAFWILDSGFRLLHLVGREGGIQRFPRLFHQLYVQTQRLQFAYQDVEGFRHAGFGGRFPFHNCFVDFGSSVYVVGLG